MDVMGIRLGSDTVEILHQEVPLCGWRVSTGTSGAWWWGVVVGSGGGDGGDHLLCSPFCLHRLGSPRGRGQSLQPHLSLRPCSWRRTLGPASLSIPGGAQPYPPHPVPSPTGSLPLPTFWFSPVLPAHTAAPPIPCQMLFKF